MAPPADARASRGFELLLAFLEGGTAPLNGYEAARARLIDFFRWRAVADPEDCADRTLDRVAGKLLQGEQPSTPEPFRYVLGVARFIYLERTKAEVRQRTAHIDAMTTTVAPPTGPALEEERLRHLDRCLEALHPNERTMVLRYHKNDGRHRIRDRQAQADELGVGLNTLRIRIHRLRRRLEDCLRRAINDETESD